uniref:StAR-related lipid transfer protein 13 n=1 Tax=Lygus hesperus TaxID=30085 RepID=A0A0A9YIE4_LYGHE
MLFLHTMTHMPHSSPFLPLLTVVTTRVSLVPWYTVIMLVALLNAHSVAVFHVWLKPDESAVPVKLLVAMVVVIAGFLDGPLHIVQPTHTVAHNNQHIIHVTPLLLLVIVLIVTLTRPGKLKETMTTKMRCGCTLMTVSLL